MEFVFIARKSVTDTQHEAIINDIAEANIRSRKNYAKIHRVLKNRGTSFVISKMPFLETLPIEAEYFSNNDFFMKIRIVAKTIMINVDDAAIRKIEQASMLKLSEISKIRGFFHEKLGMEPPKTLNSVEGLRDEIIKALKHNGVEVYG